jgi:hypothetical protein
MYGKLSGDAATPGRSPAQKDTGTSKLPDSWYSNFSSYKTIVAPPGFNPPGPDVFIRYLG